VNGGVTRRAGLFWLLRPKFRTKVNRARTAEGKLFKTFLLGFMGLFFWSLIFAVIFRMLIYFRGTQGIGDLLAAKLLGLAFVTFLMILVLSNVITALSTFFLSEDLELVVAAPVEAETVYAARLIETIVDSSWMVALLAVPLLIAYGVVYTASGWYYLLAVGTLIPFLIIPAVLGAAVTLVLVNVFPARRTRDLLALIGLFAAAGVVALFRFLRPERLMRPEEFRDLVDFMAVLRTPTSPWLPSEWAADALMSYLGGFFEWFPFAFLWSTAGVCLVFGAWLHRRFFDAGFTRAQEGAEHQEGRSRSRRLELLFAGVRPSTRNLVSKEIRVFFRDTTQWSQLILLAVLVVVYIYNIRALPVNTEGVSFFFANVVAFVNVGLAGFVLSAIAARFVLPGVSLEGPTLWLLRSSPLRPRDLLWSKYWVGTVPLLVMAVTLTLGTNILLKVGLVMMALSLVTIAAMSFALSALALAFGTLFPQFETENAAQIPTSMGGLLFMMSAISLVGIVLVLESWPVLTIFRQRLYGVGLTTESLMVAVGGGAAALLICMAATLVPLRVALRRMEAFEA